MQDDVAALDAPEDIFVVAEVAPDDFDPVPEGFKTAVFCLSRQGQDLDAVSEFSAMGKQLPQSGLPHRAGCSGQKYRFLHNGGKDTKTLLNRGGSGGSTP